MMTTQSNAERLGRSLGRMWHGYMRRERWFVGLLAAKGLPAGGTVALLWTAKLAAFVGLLYIAFWLVLLLIFTAAAAWFVRNADVDDEKQPELRDGHSGIGLYDKDDWRIDMGDPNDP